MGIIRVWQFRQKQIYTSWVGIYIVDASQVRTLSHHGWTGSRSRSIPRWAKEFLADFFERRRRDGTFSKFRDVIIPSRGGWQSTLSSTDGMVCVKILDFGDVGRESDLSYAHRQTGPHL